MVWQVSEVFLIYITAILIVSSVFTVTNAILMKLLSSMVIHNYPFIHGTNIKKKSNLFFHY